MRGLVKSGVLFAARLLRTISRASYDRFVGVNAFARFLGNTNRCLPGGLCSTAGATMHPVVECCRARSY